MRAQSWLVGLAVIATWFGCGDGEGGGAGGGSSTQSGAGGSPPDDGRLRPPPNGVAIAEAAACRKLERAFLDRSGVLGCLSTVRSCPDLLRVGSAAPDCSEYDEGTADGCADHVTAAPDCDALRTHVEGCVVAPIADSAPAGCPE